MTRLDLKKVTLWSCIWTHDEALLRRTMDTLCYTMSLAEFGDVILFTCDPIECNAPWRVVSIPVLEWSSWSEFINYELPKHIQTEFAMSVHDDGFILEPSLWTPEFLEHDYIGAPWKDGVVGNGGFSIESKKMMEAVMLLPKADVNADELVCRTHRAALETAGIRFAPRELAEKFSTELVGNEHPSFGFHGRDRSPEKYASGWALIKEWQRPNTEIVYIYLANPPEYQELARRFIASYLQHPPGAQHSTVIVCNRGLPNEEMRNLFNQLPNVRFMQHDNSGHDIGGFIAAAKQSPVELLLCCGSTCYFWRNGWLDRIVQARLKHGSGIYGTSSSYQEMPHLNTTGFLCDATLLETYPWPVLSLQDRYSFEQNKNNLQRTFWKFVRSVGGRALLVTWDGEYEWWDWRKPANIFRSGDQSNMLIRWKHSDLWHNWDPNTKRVITGITNNITDRRFNLYTNPVSYDKWNL